jgi:hypothetical protein
MSYMGNRLNVWLVEHRLRIQITSLVTLSEKAVAMPQLRRLVVGFEPRSGHVGFVVDKMALG